MSNLSHASVCTGLGASEIAASWLGWKNVFMSEIDEFCRSVLTYHFSKTMLHGDFTKECFRKYRGLVDVFTAGFPCQPFSVSGERKGAQDHRHLWPHVYRLVDEIQPPWFIGENVAGITSMVFPGNEVEVESQASLFETSDKETILEQEYILESICQDLEQIGYSVQPFIIPACAVGAPHRRDRIFIIANRADSRIEGLQRKRENGIYRSEIITDTNSNDARGCEYGKIGCEKRENESEQKEREWIRSNFERISDKGTIANPECKGGRQVHKEVQPEQSNGQSTDSTGRKRNVADTTRKQGERMQFEQSQFGKSKQGEFGRSNCRCSSRYNFRNFPTQSPICRGNDGLPFNVEHLTIPYTKWRGESIKGYGNAIVPEAMYQILEIIDRIENIQE